MRLLRTALAASLQLGLITLPCAAAAQDRDEFDVSAACVRVELLQAVGDRVPPEEAARCAAQPKRSSPPPPVRPAPPPGSKGAARDGYFAPPVLATEPPLLQQRPTWLDGKVPEGKILFGVGMVTKADSSGAEERRLAMQRATFEIAAQIQTVIDSALTSNQSAASSEVKGADGRTRSTAASAQAFSSTTRMLVQSAIDGLKLEGVYRDPQSGNYWLLASLDQAEIERREDAVAEAVMAAMTAAAEQVVDAFKKDALSQEVIFGLADAIEQANVVGRSPIGRKVKGRWKTAQDQLLRTAKRLASCVEVKGGYADAARTLVELRATCGGKPLRGAHLIGRIEGGVLDVPPSLVADMNGLFQFRPGTVHGKQIVKVTFLNDFQGLRAASLLGEPRPSQHATLELRATAEALATFSLVGLPSGSPEASAVEKAVAGFLERRLGTRLSDRGDLKAVATISLGSSVTVGAQTSQPVDLNVTVVGPRGRLFEKSARSAGLADGEQAARKQAIQRVVDGMRTW